MVMMMMTMMTWPDDHGYVYDDNDDTEMTMMTWPRSAAFLNFAYLFGSKSSPTYDRTLNNAHQIIILMMITNIIIMIIVMIIIKSS